MPLFDIFKAKPKEPRAMLVDDDFMLLDMYEAFLEGLGCKSIKVFDARDAVPTAEKEQPQLAILDITMPGITGLQILAMLKAKPSTQNIPVLMITGEHATGDVETAFQLGAADYLVKPANRASFEEKVRPLLFPPPRPAGKP